MNKMKYLAGCDEQPVSDRSSPIVHYGYRHDRLHFVRLAHPDISFYSWTVPKRFS